MEKALFYGDNYALAQVFSEYGDTCRYLPILYVSEGVNSEVSINALTNNVDLDKIKNLDTKILMDSFDVFIRIGNITPILEKYVKSTEVQQKIFEKETAKKKFCIGLKTDDYSNAYTFICSTVRRLRANGFRVMISTDSAQLEELITLMRQDTTPDIELFFSENYQIYYSFNLTDKNIQENTNLLMDMLLPRCKQIVSKKEWIERYFKIFKETDCYNLHLFYKHKKLYLFKSCNRSTFEVPKHLNRVITAFFEEDINTLNKCEYWELFVVSEICYYEREKACQFETLFGFPYIKIANIDDVILSYLGARKCNLQCEYCFSDHQIEEKPPLSKNEVVKIADYIVKGNQNINLHIDNYIGGEPCLDFDVVQDMYYTLFKYHKAYGINTSFGFLTNGTALTEKQLEWLKENVPYVGFSLDGDKETNDAIRHDSKGKGSYESVKRSIELIRKMDWQVEIGVSCVLTANNVNIKDLFLHFIDDLGVPNVVIKPVRAPESSEYALTTKNIEGLKKGYKELFDFLFEKAKKGDITYLKSMLMPLDYAGRFFIRTFLQDRVVVKRCGSGEHIFSVGNDACIYGCDSFNGTQKAFLMDTRKGNESHKYKVPFVTQERFDCNKCWARFFCGGVCQYVQYVNNYEKNSVTMFECELAKFLIQEAISFWAAAYDEFSAETLKQIEEHIKNIGFDKYKNRDSFYYAPC